MFEALIEAATAPGALNWMVQAGYTKLILQYGKGRQPDLPETYQKLHIEMYAFKPSLLEDLQKADLIVSHAGAGTVMEALRLHKKLAVVINTRLMDNHQTELAHAMGTRRHIFVVDDPSALLVSGKDGDDDDDDDTGYCSNNTWTKLDEFVPEPYTGGDDHDFPRLLDRFMGFDDAAKGE